MELKADNGLIYQRDGDGWTVVASCISGGTLDEDLARLLAQAPKLKEQRDELLAACEELVSQMNPLPSCDCGRCQALRKAETTIAKARGEGTDE